MKFKLLNFYKKLRDRLSAEHELLLIGTVHFRSFQNKNTRQLKDYDEESSKIFNGHDTSLVHRRGNTCWVKFNDRVNKPISRSQNHKVVLKFLMYIR